MPAIDQRGDPAGAEVLAAQHLAQALRQQVGGEQAYHPVAAADRQGDADHRPPGQRPDEQRRDVAVACAEDAVK